MIKFWLFHSPYSVSKNGLWPFHLWFYKWGVGFHFRTIADAHIEWSKP